MFTPFHVFYDRQFGTLHGCIGSRGTVYFLLDDVLTGLGGILPQKAFNAAAEDIIPSTDLFEKDYGWLIPFNGLFKIWSTTKDASRRPFVDWAMSIVPKVKNSDEIPAADREFNIPEWFLFWTKAGANLILAWAVWVIGVGLAEYLLKLIS